MVFSDTSQKDGLIQDCEMELFGVYAEISGNANRLYDFTARINRAYDKAATAIMSSDGRWQWDDSNYTTMPIGTTNIVSGQRDYTIDVEHLSINKVLIKDTAGNWTEILPFDQNDPGASAYLENNAGNSGIPTSYDKLGSSIFLQPIPNYNSTAGLKVYFQRKPSYFTYTDTTKSAGIPAIFHRYLSLEASYDYAVSKQLPLQQGLLVKVREMEDRMAEFYSKRSKDEQKYFYSRSQDTR